MASSCRRMIQTHWRRPSNGSTGSALFVRASAPPAGSACVRTSRGDIFGRGSWKHTNVRKVSAALLQPLECHERSPEFGQLDVGCSALDVGRWPPPMNVLVLQLKRIGDLVLT